MKNLSILVIGSLFLASCGQKTSPTKNKKDDPIYCLTEALCMPKMDWQIFYAGNNFPENVEILMDSHSVLNECQAQPNLEYNINRHNTGVEITLTNFMTLPGNEAKFGFMVKDLGNCYEEAKVFYSKKEQEYLVERNGNQRNVVIDIMN